MKHFMKKLSIILATILLFCCVSSCANSINNPTETVPHSPASEAVEDPDVHGELISFTVSCSTPVISTEDLYVTIVATAKNPGEGIHRGEHWSLKSVEGQIKTEIGYIGYDVAVTQEPENETSYAQQTMPFYFSKFVSDEGTSVTTLAPGRYCIDHLNDRGIVVARVYFDVKS